MRFSEFWPIYLRSHRHPATRGAHYLATAVGIAGGVAAASPVAPWWFVFGGIAIGYLLAFTSHWLIEHNNPCVMRDWRITTFLLGAAADIRMCVMAISGGVTAEFRRQGLDEARSGRNPGLEGKSKRPAGS